MVISRSDAIFLVSSMRTRSATCPSHVSHSGPSEIVEDLTSKSRFPASPIPDLKLTIGSVALHSAVVKQSRSKSKSSVLFLANAKSPPRRKAWFSPLHFVLIWTTRPEAKEVKPTTAAVTTDGAMQMRRDITVRCVLPIPRPGRGPVQRNGGETPPMMEE